MNPIKINRVTKNIIKNLFQFQICFNFKFVSIYCTRIFPILHIFISILIILQASTSSASLTAGRPSRRKSQTASNRRSSPIEGQSGLPRARQQTPSRAPSTSPSAASSATSPSATSQSTTSPSATSQSTASPTATNPTATRDKDKFINCGMCDACRDMVKYGGRGRYGRPCV